MLWDKIRIFVVLGLTFIFATTQAFAVSGLASQSNDFYIWTQLKKDKGFELIMKSFEKEDIFISNSVYAKLDTNLADLKALLTRGGAITISMRVPTATEIGENAANYTLKADASDADLKALKHRVIITEVNWGTDSPHRTSAQWLELYNTGALKVSDYIRHRTHSQLDPAVVPEPGKTFMWDDDDNENTDARKYVVMDRVATIDRFGKAWELKGADGDTDGDADTGAAPTDMVSMYRKIELDATGKAYKVEGGKLKGLGDGSAEASWEASKYRHNYGQGNYKGSPGAVHSAGPGGPGVGFAMNPASISPTGIIINEVRNDTSSANLDWIELFYNSENASDAAVNIKNYELSLVMGKMKDDGSGYHESGDANFTDTSLAVLPEYQMNPGEYLVVYNRDPQRNVDLAVGKNVQDLLDKTDINKGASHKYVVAKNLNLPAEGKFLILLRTRDSADDVGKPTNIKDYAGNGFFKRVEDNKFNTYVWPFVGWTKPGDVDDNDFGGTNTFASRTMSFGRDVALNAQGKYWAKSQANRVHKNDWKTFGFMGAGYDRGLAKSVDTVASPGTPGYPNTAVNTIADDKDTASTADDYAFDGKVSISEIMYDAGPRWNLAQWIELYNSSMTETINLEGWELEIRNEDTSIEAYVDAALTFDAGTYIPPNQTLLLVSGSGASDVADNYVYNLQEKHQSDLGLTTRGRRLLSAEGFHLELRAKVNEAGESGMTIVDEAGNVEIEGATRMQAWKLPERGEVRTSIVRTYGGVFNDMNKKAMGAGPHDADPGLMEASWRQSDLMGNALTFYGHRNDVGTPGYRLGGPLPVSLSSFRPVRNTTTGHVEITWITQSELNNAGFNILRSESKTGDFSVINTKGLIAGHGTTSEKHVYTYTDTTAKPNAIYYYQIEDVSMDGVRTTLQTTHLRGEVSASGKLTTRWGKLKSADK